MLLAASSFLLPQRGFIHRQGASPSLHAACMPRMVFIAFIWNWLSTHTHMWTHTCTHFLTLCSISIKSLWAVFLVFGSDNKLEMGIHTCLIWHVKINPFKSSEKLLKTKVTQNVFNLSRLWTFAVLASCSHWAKATFPCTKLDIMRWDRYWTCPFWPQRCSFDSLCSWFPVQFVTVALLLATLLYIINVFMQTLP